MKTAAFLFIVVCAFACQQPNEIVEIETKFGTIEVELYVNDAPITAKNFAKYVEEQRYQGASFYRTVTMDNQPANDVKIQVVQGGLYEDDHPLALPPIPHETTDKTGILHEPGTISMARYEPGTATFEFFICMRRIPALDYGGTRNKDGQGFAAFGKVTKGMDIVRKIYLQPERDQYLEPQVEIIGMRMKKEQS